MEYLVTANTDIGTVKQTNQDSVSVKVIHTCQGKMVFALLCDGMGGLEKGEVASASVVAAFDRWIRERLPILCQKQIEDGDIRSEWEELISHLNTTIKQYGAVRGVKLGTTIAAILITRQRYYIVNVGDSRVYEIGDCLRQLTEDQTFVAREIALGNMTAEEAKADDRRNVLLQCVGASEDVFPDFFFGTPLQQGVYMLCSDGFRHEISAEEIYRFLCPQELWDEETINQRALELIHLNKERMESDNISVIVIRTF